MLILSAPSLSRSFNQIFPCASRWYPPQEPQREIYTQEFTGCRQHESCVFMPHCGLFTSPFPPLHLTHDDREHLHDTANELVHETEKLYENYLWSDHCMIDAGKWALIKAKEDVRVYHDLRPGGGTGSKDMYLLLTVGTVKGTLHDAMYGVLNHTTDDMRIKTAYVKDTLIDSTVLKTIVEPSIEEPFQSMTVRWYVKDIPFFVRPIAKGKYPDNVYLEATGMKTLSNGERVGYHLMHSIAFKDAPVLPRFIRFSNSICAMWRQVDSERVEAFMTTYLEFKKTFVPASVITKSTADSLVSLWKVVECAHKKKLAHLVINKPKRSHAKATNVCAVCKKPSRVVTRELKSICAICDHTTCKQCCLKRELAFFASNGDLFREKMRVCIPCVSRTNRMDAAAVAQAEVQTRTKTKRNNYR